MLIGEGKFHRLVLPVMVHEAKRQFSKVMCAEMQCLKGEDAYGHLSGWFNFKKTQLKTCERVVGFFGFWCKIVFLSMVSKYGVFSSEIGGGVHAYCLDCFSM